MKPANSSDKQLSEILKSWSTASSKLSGQLQVGEVNLWFKKLTFKRISADRFRLSSPGDEIRVDVPIADAKFSWQGVAKSGLTSAHRVGVLTLLLPRGDVELSLSETLDDEIFTA